VTRLPASLIAGLLATACAGGDGAEKARARLSAAEAAMTACKERIGLGHVSTPSTVVLADQASLGQPLTEESAGHLRMKVQCATELNELLDARRAAAPR
jgi:hypothetical protein